MKDSTLCQEGTFHEKKKQNKTQSLSQLAKQTDGKQNSRSFFTRLHIRDSDLSSKSTEQELGQFLYIWDVLWVLHKYPAVLIVFK